MSITEKIQKVKLEFQSDIKNLSSKNGAVDKIRIKYLSRKGRIAQLFNQMVEVARQRPAPVAEDLVTDVLA